MTDQKDSKFRDAPEEVLAMARGLISKHHPHLTEANIKFQLRDGVWKSNGRTVYGKAAKVNDQMHIITGLDFIITLNGPAWTDFMTQAEKFAVLDHELCHCGQDGFHKDGSPKWCIWPHDTEDFAGIILRHGLWSNGLKLFKKAADRYEQLPLFDAGKVVQMSAGGGR